jgi:hypothetical protein
MEIIRYINGQKLKTNNADRCIIDSDVILRTIAAVNERQRALPDNRHIREKNVEMR